MFGFCRNKPFAYCSRYKPSAKIGALAREFGVEVVHVPLRRIAKELRERHRSLRYMYLTERQWNAVLAASQESKRGWLAPQG